MFRSYSKKMIHHEKIKEVQDFLEGELSGKLADFNYDAGQKAAVFTLRIEEYRVFVTVDDDFFADNKVDEIKKKLQEFRLKEFIRHGRSKRITVTRFGLELEDL